MNFEFIDHTTTLILSEYREPTQPVCVTDCHFTVNVLDLPFATS